MDNSLSSGLVLLFAGMGSVLAMLWGVVLLGQLLIRAVNRFAPLPDPPPAEAGSPSPALVAVLSAAVEAATRGQGRIQAIRKI